MTYSGHAVIARYLKKGGTDDKTLIYNCITLNSCVSFVSTVLYIISQVFSYTALYVNASLSVPPSEAEG